MSDFVTISELSIAFDEAKPVVDQVNIQIRKGEKVAIVGESGSGKTLTSLSLLGLLPDGSRDHSKGSIYVKFETDILNITEMSDDDLNAIRGKRISMIFQEPMSSLDPVYKCGYQVDESYLNHISKDKRAAKERTLELFRLVQLHDPERVYDSYPHEISGGQIQRVMIAMALMCDPDLLIADEPTTALDVTIQKEIIYLLNHLSEELNMALLFISHDLALVSQISDRVYVMYNGNIVEEGVTSAVFSNPNHRYTQALLECHPGLDKRPFELATVSRIMDNNGDPDKQPVIRAFQDEKVLRAQRVSKTYFKSKLFGLSKVASTQALKDVSFHLKKQEILGIVGESGSGKSTLIKCILGIEKADSGEVMFENVDLLKLNNNQWKLYRKRIQIIFQDPYSALNPKMKIGKTITEALKVKRYKGNIKKRLDELLSLVNLTPDYADRYPSQLSGGQRQRVCIARALAMEPEILLCDESVSALDVSVQAQVLNLLLKLRSSQDLSIIFITHDFSVVSYLADRIMVMQNGVVVEEGSPEGILNNPQNPYTIKLIDSIPQFIKN